MKSRKIVKSWFRAFRARWSVQELSIAQNGCQIRNQHPKMSHRTNALIIPSTF
jgi:hypothetical protein